MCGIVGILYRDSHRPVNVALLKAMADSIAHRGPDGEGVFRAPGVGLAHRRLAIIDLSGGDQPMSNEDGSVQVVFNGEIYNFQQVRRELEAKGHTFRTRSDTEVLVHGYEEERDSGVGSGALYAPYVTRLRGMFAFALWDARRRRLVLARDRVGLKPLYVYRDEEKLLFGSEVKAILAHPDVKRDIDPHAVDEYLALGMIAGERSIFRHIRKLAPGHVMTVEPGQWDRRPRRYWQLRIEPDEGRPLEDWQEAVEAKVAETVAAHQIADVPVGAFLSGGLDSSVMVGLQTGWGRGEVGAWGSGGEKIQTFSIGFKEAEFSELPLARQVAERFGTRHTEEVLTAEAVGALDDLVRYYDEPFADSSAIPTLWVSRLARRSVKVVLSGDGGDEAFGGYARYAHDLREAAWRQSLPGWLRRGVLGPAARAWPKADWLPRPLRAKTMLTNLALDGPDAYANTLTLCRGAWRRRLLAADVAAELNGHRPEEAIREWFAAAPARDPLAGMISADVHVVLPDDFLVKVDRASMACGLEVRPPLVDHELLELVARMPSRYKVRDGETKWLFKQIYRDRLPEGFTTRPKHGFEIPIDGWLRGPLREVFETTVLSRGARAAELINQGTARRMYRSHLVRTGRHGSVLWSLLVLARWAEEYM